MAPDTTSAESLGASVRPQKRARTDAADHSTYGKDPDYYFADGTICICVEGTPFRVHQGVHIRHSQVFRDMLSVPRPMNGGQVDDEFEDVPVVELNDRAEDMRALFRIMYDSQ